MSASHQDVLASPLFGGRKCHRPAPTRNTSVMTNISRLDIYCEIISNQRACKETSSSSQRGIEGGEPRGHVEIHCGRSCSAPSVVARTCQWNPARCPKQSQSKRHTPGEDWTPQSNVTQFMPSNDAPNQDGCHMSTSSRVGLHTPARPITSQS